VSTTGGTISFDVALGDGVAVDSRSEVRDDSDGSPSFPETSPDGGSGGGTAPSCALLPATCGSLANESCCSSPRVPGGTVKQTQPADFYLDKYEVTVGRFRAFLDAGQGTQSNPPAAGTGENGWDPAWKSFLAQSTQSLKNRLRCGATAPTWTETAEEKENRPINCIDWYTAFAFCDWDKGRLPTKAEVRYAAQGGSEQRTYPWGSTEPNISLANYACMGDGDPVCAGRTDILSVGMKPDGNGRWGHSDLAGNVAEWNVQRGFVGGGFADKDASNLRADQPAGATDPMTNFGFLGFRCARDL
jgi:hypothetical protein